MTSLEGKWKLSQNRAPQDKAAFIKAVEARGDTELAQAMREAVEDAPKPG